MILTIASNKGGVAKTTTAVTVAYALAERGHPTLILDLDSQGHAAINLGFDPAPQVDEWLTHSLVSDAFRATDIATRVRDNGLRLLRGDSRTKLVDTRYRGQSGGLNTLRGLIAREGVNHTVVIDTPPSGMMQEAALAAADVVIIPFRCDTLSLDGIGATLEILKLLGRFDQSRVVMLPVDVDRRIGEQTYNLQTAIEAYQAAVADPIPRRAAVMEAVAYGKTIWEHKDKGSGIRDVRVAYEALMERLVPRLEGYRVNDERN